MSQATLAGFEAAEPTDRLFFALFPDRDTAGRIAAFAAMQCANHGLRGRPLSTDRLHVTLFHLVDSVGLRDDVVRAAEQAAAQVRGAPFDVSFDQVATFANRRRHKPFVLKSSGGNDPLHAFHAQLGRALSATGLGRCVTAAFEPHVTLAYDARDVATEPVTPVSWRAGEFVLVHSLLGKTQHIPLARWALDGSRLSA
ncbi:2'-5' RNA ligase family protein [Rhodanobacter sp. Col0626]|uniref:2'-5' RNA ligase family protein n=1 Tax=Rhodanobacter sp. Col0626 TaxID=3415679 RepID=UPI003CEE33D7